MCSLQPGQSVVNNLVTIRRSLECVVRKPIRTLLLLMYVKSRLESSIIEREPLGNTKGTQC